MPALFESANLPPNFTTTEEMDHPTQKHQKRTFSKPCYGTWTRRRTSNVAKRPFHSMVGCHHGKKEEEKGSECGNLPFKMPGEMPRISA